MVYCYAALSVLAAGFLFRSDWVDLRSFRRSGFGSPQWPWLVLRVAAIVVMLACGGAASALFGTHGTDSAFARMAAVLWAPQLVLALIFGYKPGGSAPAQPQPQALDA